MLPSYFKLVFLQIYFVLYVFNWAFLTVYVGLYVDIILLSSSCWCLSFVPHLRFEMEDLKSLNLLLVLLHTLPHCSNALHLYQAQTGTNPAIILYWEELTVTHPWCSTMCLKSTCWRFRKWPLKMKYLAVALLLCLHSMLHLWSFVLLSFFSIPFLSL